MLCNNFGKQKNDDETQVKLEVSDLQEGGQRVVISSILQRAACEHCFNMKSCPHSRTVLQEAIEGAEFGCGLGRKILGSKDK
jgi:hypothetical protein